VKTLGLLVRAAVFVVVVVAAIGLVVLTAPDVAAALLAGFGQALDAGATWIAEEVAS